MVAATYRSSALGLGSSRDFSRDSPRGQMYDMTRLENYAADCGIAPIAWTGLVDERMAFGRQAEIDYLVSGGRMAEAKGGEAKGGSGSNGRFRYITYKYADGSTRFYDPSGRNGYFYIRKQADGSPIFEGDHHVVEEIGGRANIDGVWKHIMGDWDFNKD